MNGAGSRAVLPPGSRLADRYLIGEELGRGGMSVVYEAQDLELGHDVALKLLLPPPGAAELARERMRREVLAARSLRHAHIVKVFDIQDEGPWTFIVLEKIVGVDLHTRVMTRGPLSADRVRTLGLEMADALAFAHHEGVLHRDIKPHNILIEEADGRSVLTDFGSARIEGQTTLTAAGDMVGTLAYMAPEEIAGKRADARSDLYSLGMTLYFALTGALPGGESGAMLPPTARRDGFRPSEAVSVPESLDDAIAWATCSEPSDRVRTGASLREILDDASSTGIPCVPSRIVAEDARCLLCGGPEPFGFAVCPGCQRSDGLSDLEVVLEASSIDLPVVIDKLRSWSSPDVDSEALRDAALGRRPLLRVSPDASVGLLETLSQRGLQARTQAPGRTDRLVPRSLKLAILAVMALAAACVALGSSLLGIAGFVIAAGAFVRAQSLAGTPLLGSGAESGQQGARRAEWLPASVEQEVLDTLQSLPAGAARGLVADMVRLLRPRDTRSIAAEDLSTSLTERANALLLATCTGARELAELDETLETLEARRHDKSLPASWRSAAGRAEQARDALVQRLLESAGALATAGGLRSDAAGLDDQLAELTRELEGEIEIQATAAKEAADWMAGAV